MTDQITVEFSADTQSLAALQGAAYRAMSVAACQIDSQNGRFICRLTPRAAQPGAKIPAADDVKLRFLDIVADENLRERLEPKVEPVRNLILSLAFGSLAADKS